MQTDPIGYGDGMNMYAYVGNDPINGVDPTGLICRLVTVTVGMFPEADSLAIHVDSVEEIGEAW